MAGLFSVRQDTRLPDLVLEKVRRRLRVDDVSALNTLAMQIAGMESDYGKNLKNPKSSAKGIWQFTDSSYKTAKNRLKNVIGFIPERIAKQKDIRKLSETDQRALFFAHLTEDKMSDGKIYDYLQGKVGPEKLYQFHHYKGSPTKGTKKRMKEKFRRPY